MKLIDANRKLLNTFIKNMYMPKITLQKLSPKTLKFSLGVTKSIDVQLLEDSLALLFDYARQNNIENIKFYLHLTGLKTLDFEFKENFEESLNEFKINLDNHLAEEIKPRKKEKKNSKYNKSK